FVLMLPLGILYFGIAITLLSLSLGLIWSPIAALFDGMYAGVFINGEQMLPVWATPLLAAVGLVLLFATLHLARGIGRLHGQVAKHLLVRLG
ncbi:MAG TPA: hypothetical protein DDZ67_14725, partial [Xanthomonadaceae bacterium]|nr:hypothetical protein [Xanthomonadaceae bacterium]